MWTVIYIAPNKKIADKIYERLTEEGFLVKINPSQHGKQYEILVPEGELDEIRDVLAFILQ